MQLTPVPRRGGPEDRVDGDDPLRFREGEARWLDEGSADELSELVDACREDLRLAAGGDAPEPHRLMRACADVHEGGERRLLGLFDDGGRLVAVMDAWRHRPSGDAWQLAVLLVRPDLRGRGIGTGMLARLERLAAADGATSIEAVAPGRNPAVLQLLRRAGFEPREDVVLEVAGRELRARRLVRAVPPALLHG